AVSLGAAIDRYGADALRYFLLREVGFENDGNFSWERFDARYVADLADTFGNLVSRTLAMVQRYRAGVVPKDPQGYNTPLERVAQEVLGAYARAMNAFDLQQGAALVIELASHANRYIEEQAPWKLAKEKKDGELDSVLANLVRTVARLAVLAAPFVPSKAQEIWRVLGATRELSGVALADLGRIDVTGWTVLKPPPLFPKPPDA
ncbi:MAG TPA: class I tRNA ligase family protein, partial [Gemmatimonadales bacterium]|nr:class I tRNA ligase family protein [Gemmatimonadales bacterium]